MTVHYLLGERSGEVLSALQKRFVCRPEPPVDRRTTYFDSFDWRLARRQWLLRAVQGRGGWELTLGDPAGRDERRWRQRKPPGFAAEISDGDRRAELQAILEMRRLLPLVEVQEACLEWRLLDSREKTVVRTRFTQAQAAAPDHPKEGRTLPGILQVVPLRGYDSEFAAVCDFLGQELALEETADTLLGLGMLAIGRRVGDYSSKLEVALEDTMSVGEAATAVFRDLLTTLRANEEGIRRSLDTEFLHDFRVAVRRTRSGLAQLKGLLPDAELAAFRDAFAWLGTITGPARDLDVQLLKIDELIRELPGDVQHDLKPLRVYLQRRQRRASRELIRRLGSRRYERLSRDWTDFLEQVAAGRVAVGPAYTSPVRPVVSRRIGKVLRRVLKQGRRVTDDSPSASLHALRIECKKLRYLVEFFRSLYPAGEMKAILKALKGLQDNLGDFNDAVVQQERLREYALEMQVEGMAPPPTLIALGRLLERLSERQCRERERFTARFEAFQTDETLQRFQRAIQPSPEEP